MEKQYTLRVDSEPKNQALSDKQIYNSLTKELQTHFGDDLSTCWGEFDLDNDLIRWSTEHKEVRFRVTVECFGEYKDNYVIYLKNGKYQYGYIRCTYPEFNPTAVMGQHIDTLSMLVADKLVESTDWCKLEELLSTVPEEKLKEFLDKS